MKVYKLAIMGFAIALNVILTRFVYVIIPIFGFPAIRISFGITLLMTIVFGPMCGAIVGALTDLIGALAFPIGPYFPGFTLTSFLTGIVSGYVFLFFNRKKANITFSACFIAAFFKFFLALILNTFWVSVLFSTPFEVLIVPRLIATIIKIIAFTPIVFLMSKFLIKIIPKEKIR